MSTDEKNEGNSIFHGTQNCHKSLKCRKTKQGGDGKDQGCFEISNG